MPRTDDGYLEFLESMKRPKQQARTSTVPSKMTPREWVELWDRIYRETMQLGVQLGGSSPEELSERCVTITDKVVERMRQLETGLIREAQPESPIDP